MLMRIALVGLVSVACADNTRCSIGTLLCTDESGAIGEDRDQQLRACSNDAALGGDQDGEFVVVAECALAGEACTVEFFGEGRDVGGCISRACKDDDIEDCLELGRAICAFAESTLFVCAVEELSGCQRYVEDVGCRDSGGRCVEQRGEVACVIE